MTPINCLQLTSRLSAGQRWRFFKAPSPPAAIRRAALKLRTLTFSQSDHTDGQGGRREARRWETNRDTQQHNVKVKRNSSHRCIRLVLRWQERRVQGCRASIGYEE